MPRGEKTKDKGPEAECARWGRRGTAESGGRGGGWGWRVIGVTLL